MGDVMLNGRKPQDWERPAIERVTRMSWSGTWPSSRG